MTPYLPFYRKRGESIAPGRRQELHRKEPLHSCFSSYTVLIPTNKINLPLKKAPPLAGPRPSPPGGGEGASIAQMYICAACRGNPLAPMPPAGGKLAVARPPLSADCIRLLPPSVVWFGLRKPHHMTKRRN